MMTIRAVTPTYPVSSFHHGELIGCGFPKLDTHGVNAASLTPRSDFTFHDTQWRRVTSHFKTKSLDFTGDDITKTRSNTRCGFSSFDAQGRNAAPLKTQRSGRTSIDAHRRDAASLFEIGVLTLRIVTPSGSLSRLIKYNSDNA